MKKLVSVIGLIVLLGINMSGCVLFSDNLLSLKSTVKGLPMSIQTYSDNGKLLDKITGDSINFTSVRI